MYLLRFDGFDVVGSSPEALVKVTGGRAMMHPIAGHPLARRDPGGGRRAGRRAARRPQGARRAPHARRPRPQRPRPGVRAGHRRGRRLHVGRALQPRHAHRVARSSGSVAPGRTAFDVLARLLPGRHAVRRAQAARDGDHRRARADPARRLRRRASATSTSPATSTWRSRSAPRCCATAWPTCRPAPASSPTPTRPPRTRSAATRRWPCCAPWPRRRTLRAGDVTPRREMAAALGAGRRSAPRSCPGRRRAGPASAAPGRAAGAPGAASGTRPGRPGGCGALLSGGGRPPCSVPRWARSASASCCSASAGPRRSSRPVADRRWAGPGRAVAAAVGLGALARRGAGRGWPQPRRRYETPARRPPAPRGHLGRAGPRRGPHGLTGPGTICRARPGTRRTDSGGRRHVGKPREHAGRLDGGQHHVRRLPDQRHRPAPRAARGCSSSAWSSWRSAPWSAR